MRTRINTPAFISFVALVLLCVACVKDPENLVPNGSQINFGAAAGYTNMPQTRTEYSGVDENGNPISNISDYERIDWVAEHDKIRILCAQAVNQDNQPNTSGTYQIGTLTPNGKDSEADAELMSGSTPFYWGEGTHYFYALYPAAGTTSNYHDGSVTDSESSIEALTGNKAKITGAIPAAQTAVKSGMVYKPNMNLAYMYAAEKTEKVWGVTLHFHPLVTAFEFSLMAFDEQMATIDLESLKLSSTSTDLTGGFTATLDLDAATTASIQKAEGTTGNEVMVTMPSGTKLSEDQYSVFTVLALGVEQTNLTLTLNFAGGITRSLALNRSVSGVSTPITVQACKKAYFKLDVPAPEDWDYHIGSLSPITVEYYGGSGSLASGFTSYKTNGSATEAVPFVLEYSASASGPWSPTCDWITPNGVNYGGSITGQNFSATIAPQANTGNDPHRTALAAATPKNNFDLSTKNVATGATVARTTANCYVVDAPGTYRFPLVYGNAIKNNGLNEGAFRGNFHGVGGGFWYRYGYWYGNRNEGFMLGTFRDHNNNLITNAMHNAGAQASDVYIAQKFSNLNAILVWEDSPGLVQVDAAISGSGQDAYITFNVPQSTITEGNALIAVRSGNTILWSWHIWVTDRNLAAGISGPSGRVFSPANLGWCDGKSLQFAQRQFYVRARQPESGKTSNVALVTEKPYSLVMKGNNTYYQWGRKDPMQAGDGQGLGTDGTQNFKHYYSYNGYAPVHSGTGRVNIGVTIQNPHVEYNTTHADNYDWSNTIFQYADGNNGTNGVMSILNLWNSSVDQASGVNSTEAFTREVTKTIYDPSPVGYKVPNEAAFVGLNNSNFPWTTVNGDYGRRYGNLFFPAVGGYSGDIHGVNLSGSYFLATENWSDGSCDVFQFTESFVHYGGTYYNFKLNCWCIRPIRE